MRPLHAPTYDYLKGRADSLGGVGHSRFTIDTAPCCIWGMLSHGPNNPRTAASWVAHATAMRYAGLDPVYSDSAFGVDEKENPDFRLPFDEWARRLRVQRWVPRVGGALTDSGDEYEVLDG